MHKHTPGPWEHFGGFRVGWARRDPKGKLIETGVICDTANNKATRTPENEANAHLIAAAPELLEVLETIENDANQVPDWLWSRIKAAIKKARGE